MARRKGDMEVGAMVSPEEYEVVKAMARRLRCSGLSDLVRQALNSLALEAGEDAPLLELRRPGIHWKRAQQWKTSETSSASIAQRQPVSAGSSS